MSAAPPDSGKPSRTDCAKKRKTKPIWEERFFMIWQRLSLDAFELIHAKQSQFPGSIMGHHGVGRLRQPAQSATPAQCEYPATGSAGGKAKKRANEANFTWPLNAHRQRVNIDSFGLAYVERSQFPGVDRHWRVPASPQRGGHGSRVVSLGFRPHSPPCVTLR